MKHVCIQMNTKFGYIKRTMFEYITIILPGGLDNVLVHICIRFGRVEGRSDGITIYHLRIISL